MIDVSFHSPSSAPCPDGFCEGPHGRGETIKDLLREAARSGKGASNLASPMMPDLPGNLAHPAYVQLSVVVPAYNEERTITSTIRSLEQFLAGKGFGFEVIVVDDGSHDGTAQVVQALQGPKTPLILLRNERNRGKGFSVRRGMLAARGEYRVFTDADLAYSVESVESVHSALQHCDICIGSRALPGSEVRARSPLARRLASRMYSSFVRLFLLPGMNDTQCGLKGIRGEAANRIFSRLTIDRFAFDVEFLYVARKLGYAIQTMPMRPTSASRTSRVRLVQDSLDMLVALFTIRHNDLRGLYGE